MLNATSIVFIVLFLLCLAGMGIGVYKQFEKGKIYLGVVMLLVALDMMVAFISGGFLIDMKMESMPLILTWTISTCLIMPLLYMFFAESGGRHRFNPTTIANFLLLGLLFIPASMIELDGALVTASAESIPEYGDLAPFSLSFFMKGKIVFWVRFMGVITLIQMFISMRRFYQLRRSVVKLGGHYSVMANLAVTWSLVMCLELVLLSVLPLHILRMPFLNYPLETLVVMTTALGVFIWWRGFDINPVKTVNDHEESVDAHVFLEENNNLLMQMRKLFEVEKIFLKPGIQTDDVVERLGTNRAYLNKLMLEQYGKSFVEFVNTQRINYAQEIMLSEPDLPMDQVAKTCGYLSANDLVSVFRRITGQEPEEWKWANQTVASHA